MRQLQRKVLLLHEDAVLTAKIKTVSHRHGWALEVLPDWDELADCTKAAPASALVIVDPYWRVPQGEGLSIELSSFLNRFPSVTVVGGLRLSAHRLDDVRRLGELGVVQVIDLEYEISEVELGFRLLESRGRPLRNLVHRILPPRIGGAARSILAAAVTIACDGGGGADLARAFHITPRTLTRWSRRAGLPPPRHILAWMRVMLAAELLDDPGRTVSDAALSCGYASDGSLRQALRSFVELSPTRLRELGAFAAVSERFVAALAQARSERTRYRVQKRV